MDKKKPDALLQEIEDMIREKPKSPDSNWYGTLCRLLCFAPLKLTAEHPLIGTDGHKYLSFAVPPKEEIADVDYSQYTLNDHAETLIEMRCGAVITYKEGTLWTFSLGSLFNFQQERHPYKHSDKRIWSWPKAKLPKEKIHILNPKETGLPEEIIEEISAFLKGIRPHIRRWGVATSPTAKAMTMFFEPSISIKEANPEEIISHLKWFTPHHFHWEALDSLQK